MLLQEQGQLSSAGTYTAWIDVIEPSFVDVIRSCKPPISVAKVGWYTADGIRPKKQKLQHQLVKRKMLSIKKRTSCLLISLKYSAIVKLLHAYVHQVARSFDRKQVLLLNLVNFFQQLDSFISA
jgi:hypothetical protein